MVSPYHLLRKPFADVVIISKLLPPVNPLLYEKGEGASHAPPPFRDIGSLTLLGQSYRS